MDEDADDNSYLDSDEDIYFNDSGDSYSQGNDDVIAEMEAMEAELAALSDIATFNVIDAVGPPRRPKLSGAAKRKKRREREKLVIVARSTSANRLQNVADKKLQVAVSRRDHPEDVMTLELMAQFSAALIDYVLALEFAEGTSLPRFIGMCPRGPYLRVSAENEYSRDWLVEHAANITVWETGAVAVLVDSIPKRIKFFIEFISQGMTGKKLMDAIEKFNPGIKTGLWHVWDEKIQGNQVRVVGCMEESCKRALSSVDDRPYLGGTRVRVRYPDIKVSCPLTIENVINVSI